MIKKIKEKIKAIWNHIVSKFWQDQILIALIRQGGVGRLHHPVLIMKTIPDAITDIKEFIRKVIDKPLSWMESFGSWMNVYAWNKRWKNRKDGYGYRKEDL